MQAEPIARRARAPAASVAGVTNAAVGAVAPQSSQTVKLYWTVTVCAHASAAESASRSPS